MELCFTEIEQTQASQELPTTNFTTQIQDELVRVCTGMRDQLMISLIFIYHIDIEEAINKQGQSSKKGLSFTPLRKDHKIEDLEKSILAFVAKCRRLIPPRTVLQEVPHFLLSTHHSLSYVSFFYFSLLDNV